MTHFGSTFETLYRSICAVVDRHRPTELKILKQAPREKIVPSDVDEVQGNRALEALNEVLKKVIVPRRLFELGVV